MQQETFDWDSIKGPIYTSFCPAPTGNPEYSERLEAIVYQMRVFDNVTFTMKDVRSKMMPWYIDDLSPPPETLSQSCGNLNKLMCIIRGELPQWASPISIGPNAVVLGQLGSGFIVHLENEDNVFVVFIELSSTKRWILKETENPFIIVKFVLTLRTIIGANYAGFRKFLEDNK
jgi:hypothetical protein